MLEVRHRRKGGAFSDQRGREEGERAGIAGLTVVADAAAVDVEVEAGLEDRVAAGVAVDPDPGGRIIRAGAARRHLGRGDDERAGHGLVRRLKREKQRLISRR